MMKFLILISVLPHIVSSPNRSPSGATETRRAPENIITEGAPQSGNTLVVAQGPSLHVEGPHVAPPAAPDSGIFEEDISTSTREKPVVLPAESGRRQLMLRFYAFHAGQSMARRPNLHVEGPHVAPPAAPDSGFFEEDISTLTREKPVVLPAESSRGKLLWRSYGHSSSIRRSLFVTICDENAWLRQPPPFSSLFADPVLDPLLSGKKVELDPLSAPMDEDTNGEGVTKTGLFYTLTGTNEQVVIKWYNPDDDALYSNAFRQHRKPPTENLASIYTDFFTQSIAHVLSKLYSRGVPEHQKVYFMQPLLVKLRVGDLIYYGLMERKFNSFHLQASTNSMQEKYDDFLSFLDHDTLLMAPEDAQGWYERGPHLYLTDTKLQFYADGVAPELIGDGTSYNLRMIYSLLAPEVEEANQAPVYPGGKRAIFGKSDADDVVKLRDIRSMKTKCIFLK